ncbi:MAG: phosphatidylglycerophosphatase A [Gammaproteobacteria bacterium]|nr:phosphatidylglycerophosphatase A [Gammaproteobacteria bacterium]
MRKVGVIAISDSPGIRETFSDPIYLLVSGFGSGLVRKAPGTCGSLAALLPFLLLTQFPPWLYLTCVAIAFLSGIFICGVAVKRLKVKDPSWIVWDEFVGLWITLFLMPQGWHYLLLGFLLFRFFDILKPWPVNYFDRNLDGGLGIMMDDAAAGVYAFTVLQLTASGVHLFL